MAIWHKKITDTKYSATLDVYITEKDKLEELEGNIQTDIDTLNKLNWKIKVGMKLTPEEVATYGATIAKFVTDSEAYIEQQQYVTKLAIDAVIDDTNFNAEITKLVDEYYNGAKGQMAQLGKDLRAETDKALADGIIDATEQKTIDNLMKEIAEINSQVADAEFKAKLQSITIDGDLTPESFKALEKEIVSAIEERTKQASGASETVLAGINLAYSSKMDKAITSSDKRAVQSAWDGAVKEVQNSLTNTKAEISLDGMSFMTDELSDKWGTELGLFGAETKGVVGSTMQGVLDEGMMSVDHGWAMTLFLTRSVDAFNDAVKNSGMDKAARTALEGMLAPLIPTEEDNQSIFDAALISGAKIPEAIISELSSTENLAALTGDIDGIYFAMGQQMALSPEIQTMLDNGEITAAELPASCIRGMQSKNTIT